MKVKLNQKVIRELRVAEGWTQEVLAEHSNVHARTIQRIENNGLASIQSMNALARALDVESSALRHIETELQTLDQQQAHKETNSTPPQFTPLSYTEKQSIKRFLQQSENMQSWLSKEWIAWMVLFAGGLLTVTVLLFAQANLFSVQAILNKSVFIGAFFVGTTIGLVLMLTGGLLINFSEKFKVQKNLAKTLTQNKGEYVGL